MWMVNERTGERSEVPHRGFSWTTLFFACFVPLFRGDWKWLLIMFLVHLAVASVTFGFGLLISWPVFAAIYNERYYQDLYNKGFRQESNA